MSRNDWIRKYHEEGFARVRKLFSAEEVREIREAISRYITDILPGVPVNDRVFEADGRSIRNCWRMERHDAFFVSLGEREAIRSLLPELVNGEPVCLGVETFNKPARVGSGVPWHQDNAYFCMEPPDVLTLWIAIDEVTPANGAVHYLPGSHKQGIFPHAPSGVAGNSMMLDGAPPAGTGSGAEFCATLEPGDAVFHHCQILHRSESNVTGKPRCGLLIVFRGPKAKPAPELHARYQRALAKTIAG